MEHLMGVINLDNEEDLLEEINYFRCTATVPFGGRYRLIDFVMTNMADAGITDLAVFIRRKYRSLLDHLGNAKQWDLDRKRGGLFLLPPDWNDPTDISLGDLRHFHNNIDYFHRGRAKYVLISGSNHICKINYKEVFHYHLQSAADVTLVYKEVPKLLSEHQNCRRLNLDDSGWVTNINNEKDKNNIFLEMYIIDKNLLLEIIADCIAHSKDNLFINGIMNKQDDLKIFAYPYQGYHGVINSLDSYYKNSMKLLDIENYHKLFFQDNFIRTKVKDQAPSRYLEGAEVSSSLIANGCKIKGKVSNSILFRGVEIEQGAQVENSIIMQKCKIGKKAVLKNVILDKDVLINEQKTLVGDTNKPFVVAKRKII